MIKQHYIQYDVPTQHSRLMELYLDAISFAKNSRFQCRNVCVHSMKYGCELIDSIISIRYARNVVAILNRTIKEPNIGVNNFSSLSIAKMSKVNAGIYPTEKSPIHGSENTDL